jgi:hypothetical protein
MKQPRITPLQLRTLAHLELLPGPATQALTSLVELREHRLELEELDADIEALNLQLARKQQDRQIAHRALIEAQKTYKERVDAGLGLAGPYGAPLHFAAWRP